MMNKTIKTINLRFDPKSGAYKPVKPVTLPSFLKNNATH